MALAKLLGVDLIKVGKLLRVGIENSKNVGVPPILGGALKALLSASSVNLQIQSTSPPSSTMYTSDVIASSAYGEGTIIYGMQKNSRSWEEGTNKNTLALPFYCVDTVAAPTLKVRVKDSRGQNKEYAITVSVNDGLGNCSSTAPIGLSDPIMQILMDSNEGTAGSPGSVVMTGNQFTNINNCYGVDVTTDGAYAAASQIPNAWIKVELPFAVIPKKITLYGDLSYTTRNTKRIKIEASLNGTDWTTLDSSFSMAQTGGTAKELYSNKSYYKYFRFTPLENWGDGSFVELGKIWIQTDAEDWNYKLNSVNYGTWTAGNTLNGEARAVARWDGVYYWQSSVVANNWIKVDFGAGNLKRAVRCELGIATWTTSNRLPKNFQVDGSNDDSSWTNLLTAITLNNSLVQTFNFSTKGYFRYYRLKVIDNWGDWLVNIGKWLLYGS